MTGFWTITAALLVLAAAGMWAIITGDPVATDESPVTTPDGHIAPAPGYAP